MPRRARKLIRKNDAEYLLSSNLAGNLEGDLLRDFERAELHRTIQKWACLFTLQISHIEVSTRGFMISCKSYAKPFSLACIKERYIAFYERFCSGAKRHERLMALEDETFLKKEQLRLSSISDFMQVVKICFTQWYNKYHNRNGPIFEGRFSSKLKRIIKTVQNLLKKLIPRKKELFRPNWIRKSYKGIFIFPYRE